MILLTVDRLPSGATAKPVWLWWSQADATVAQTDLLWRAFLRRFDIEHTFPRPRGRRAARPRSRHSHALLHPCQLCQASRGRGPDCRTDDGAIKRPQAWQRDRLENSPPAVVVGGLASARWRVDVLK